MEKLIGFILGALLVLCFISLIATVLYVIIHWNDPILTLVKSDWVCTKHETVITMQLVGKILIPIPNEYCIQYTAVSR